MKQVKVILIFFRSSTRIIVECTFGEINMRWGIFWKPLRCSLDNNTLIIEDAVRLHSFLVEYRYANVPPSNLTEEQRIFDDDCIDTDAYPIISGNDSTRHLERPSNNEREY